LGTWYLMSDGKIRGKLLVELWANGKPMTIQVLADKIGLNSSSAMGYLLGLIKAKYVEVPEKHYYCITCAGKEAIGIPTVDSGLAQCILTPVSDDKAFHFYYDVDQHSGVQANSLEDFGNKIQSVGLNSLEFHLIRKDFENWVRSLGDVELAKKLALLRAAKLSGEDLSEKLYETVNSRIEELKKLLA
jgi:hypothetical protein